MVCARSLLLSSVMAVIQVVRSRPPRDPPNGGSGGRGVSSVDGEVWTQSRFRNRNYRNLSCADQRRRTCVDTIKVKKVEGVIHEPVVPPALEVVLQRREVRPPVLHRADHFAVQHELARREVGYVGGDGAEARGPIVA